MYNDNKGYSQEQIEELKTTLMPFARTIQLSKNRWKIYFQQEKYNKTKHKYSETFNWDCYKNKKSKDKLIAEVKRVVEWKSGWGYAPKPVDKFVINVIDDWALFNDIFQMIMIKFSVKGILDKNPWKKYHLHKLRYEG